MQVLCYCLEIEPVSNSEDVQKVCSLTYSIIFPIIVSMAVVSNVINVLVLAYLHHTSTQTPSRIYLLWLAITHCLAGIPVLVGITKKPRLGVSFAWAFYFSHLETPLYNALNFVCVYIIVGLSLDRYYAVCKVQKYTQALGFKKAYLTAWLAYVAAFIFYIPYCFYQKPILRHNKSDEWDIGEGWLLQEPLWIVWANVVQIFHRIIPGIILIVTNIKIFSTVDKLRKLRQSSNGNTVRYQKDRQLLQLLLALTFVFLLTNIPSAVLKMRYMITPGYCDLTYAEEVVRAVSNCLELSGYCFDFFFYFLMNSEYNKGLRNLTHAMLYFIPYFKQKRETCNDSITSGGIG